MSEPEANPSVAGALTKLTAALEAGLPPQRMADLVSAARRELVKVEEARQRAMLTAVSADLESIDLPRVPGGRTYRQTALWLADVIDKRGAEEGPSTTAKLADQLTKVMGALTRKGGGNDDDGFSDFSDTASTPVR
jgi:hypothetical protein